MFRRIPMIIVAIVAMAIFLVGSSGCHKGAGEDARDDADITFDGGSTGAIPSSSGEEEEDDSSAAGTEASTPVARPISGTLTMFPSPSILQSEQNPLENREIPFTIGYDGDRLNSIAFHEDRSDTDYQDEVQTILWEGNRPKEFIYLRKKCITDTNDVEECRSDQFRDVLTYDGEGRPLELRTFLSHDGVAEFPMRAIRYAFSVEGDDLKRVATRYSYQPDETFVFDDAHKSVCGEEVVLFRGGLPRSVTRCQPIIFDSGCDCHTTIITIDDKGRLQLTDDGTTANAFSRDPDSERLTGWTITSRGNVAERTDIHGNAERIDRLEIFKPNDADELEKAMQITFQNQIMDEAPIFPPLFLLGSAKSSRNVSGVLRVYTLDHPERLFLAPRYPQ